MTTHDATLAFIATIRNPQTARTYAGALVRFEQIAPGDLAEIDETLLMPFMDALSGYSIATRQINLNAVTSFFAYLIYTKQSDTISLDRAKLIKRKLIGRNPKRISNYNMADVRALVDYAKGLTVNTHDDHGRPRGCVVLEALRDRALILTLAETGLRKAEAASLKLSDVAYDYSQAVVIGKGDKQAVVYFGECSKQAVREYISRRREKSPSSPLFMREGRGGLTSDTDHIHGTAINAIVNRRAAECLGHGIAVHSLRHYFVTNVWLKTRDLKLAQTLARHESIATTERYTHINDDVLKDAHRRVFA